jgi:hypothetical protein
MRCFPNYANHVARRVATALVKRKCGAARRIGPWKRKLRVVCVGRKRNFGVGRASGARKRKVGAGAPKTELSAGRAAGREPQLKF